MLFAHTLAEYEEALEKSFRYEDEVVIEEYIKGREFACGIIDGKFRRLKSFRKPDFLIMRTNIRTALLKKCVRQISHGNYRIEH